MHVHHVSRILPCGLVSVFAFLSEHPELVRPGGLRRGVVAARVASLRPNERAMAVVACLSAEPRTERIADWSSKPWRSLEGSVGPCRSATRSGVLASSKSFEQRVVYAPQTPPPRHRKTDVPLQAAGGGGSGEGELTHADKLPGVFSPFKTLRGRAASRGKPLKYIYK